MIHWKADKDNIKANMIYCYPRLERGNKDDQLLYTELLLGSFLNYPADVDKFPINFDDIAIAQANHGFQMGSPQLVVSCVALEKVLSLAAGARNSSSSCSILVFIF
jgi:hypothetical protein